MLCTDFSRRSAPPTDSELEAKGLPTNQRLSPPPEVQLAVAMSKAGRSLSTPDRMRLNFEQQQDQISPQQSSTIPPFPWTPLTVNSADSCDINNQQQSVLLSSAVSTPTAHNDSNNNNNNNNGYSLQGKMPQGVSWRYVNILNDNNNNNNNNNNH